MKNSNEESSKIKNRTIIWSNKPTSEYIPKGIIITISKRSLHSHVHCSIIQSSHNIETTSATVKGWMKKMWFYTHTHTHTHTHSLSLSKEYYSALKKKKELLSLATTYNLGDIMLITIHRKKHLHIISLICGI